MFYIVAFWQIKDLIKSLGLTQAGISGFSLKVNGITPFHIPKFTSLFLLQKLLSKCGVQKLVIYLSVSKAVTKVQHKNFSIFFFFLAPGMLWVPVPRKTLSLRFETHVESDIHLHKEY